MPKQLNKIDKFALWVTNKVGTVGFFFIIVLWTICWLGWNLISPSSLQFDPAPAFVLWLFISNLIQIFLMPLIMVGQNIQSKYTEILISKAYDLEVKIDKKLNEIKDKL
jgi:uncharacterized membrane protein